MPPPLPSLCLPENIFDSAAEGEDRLVENPLENELLPENPLDPPLGLPIRPPLPIIYLRYP